MASLKAPKITMPVRDPKEAYPPLPDHLKGEHFSLGIDPPTSEQRKQALEKSLSYLQIQQGNFLGYQIDQNLDFSADMASYLDLHVNNIGDPFGEANLTMNSKFMERAVLDYYASLWNARWPYDSKDAESYWGFCLTMGSTEANMYGMWNARDYLAGKILLWEEVPDYTIPSAAARQAVLRPRLVMRQAELPPDNSNAYTPIAFYSEDTHYSFAKAMRLIAIKTFYEVGMELYEYECPLPEWKGKSWPQEVPSENGAAGEGHIDVEALAILVDFFASKGYPILVSFNFGSTFKGAYDDVESAGNKLMPIFKKYGLDKREVNYNPANPEAKDTRTGYWIHVDGALGAAYMPFVEMAHARGLIKEKGPLFDFRLPFVHSIALSGHKWPGSPVPCGVYMSKTKYQLSPPSRPDYIGTPDTTFAGSRNGLSPMLLWHRLSNMSFEDQMHTALRNLEMAEYIYQSLLKLQDELKQDLYVARSKLSLTVLFRQANADLCHKYSVSNETLAVKTDEGLELRYYSHVFAMDHVTKELVDSFVKDLSQPGAFFEPPPSLSKMTSAPNKDLAPLKSTSLVAHVPAYGRGFTG